jgi:hypothetical protein
VSLVLTGRSHFSLEHAIQIGKFLKLNAYEQDYFLTMVQYGRAGSAELESYFLEKLKSMRKSSEIIKNNIRASTDIDPAAKSIYFSSWHFAAIHMAIQVPGLNSRENIINYFNLNPIRVDIVLEYLIKNKLAVVEKGLIRGLPLRIHLPTNSPELRNHHVNCRLNAIESLGIEFGSSMHYSLTMSISETAAAEIKNQCVQLIKNIETILEAASDEDVYTFCIDLFPLGKVRKAQ